MGVGDSDKLLRVTTMTTAAAKQIEVRAGYGQKIGADGMLYTIYNWDGARDFTIIYQGEVIHGTCCEEWVGWDLAKREQHLDEEYGRGEWSWK